MNDSTLVSEMMGGRVGGKVIYRIKGEIHPDSLKAINAWQKKFGDGSVVPREDGSITMYDTPVAA